MPTRLLLVLGTLLLSSTSVSAQVLGPFPWQLQPYCNIVTLTLTNTAAGFTLDGVDDQCGATSKASAVGVAAFGAGGDLALNFSIVLAPSGKPVHVSAIVSPATGTGTWKDSVGNSGTFAFFGQTTGLPPRPLPASGLAPGIITTAELAPGAVTGAKVADGSLTSADILDEPRAAIVGSLQQLALLTTPLTVRTISLTAPAGGRVIVNASVQGSAGSASTDDLGECWIGGTTNQSPPIRFGEAAANAASTAQIFPIGLTFGFSVASGPFTATLVCRALAGTVSVANSTMTAMYFPG